MSGRYGQWRRLVGDTERPDLLDAGKKLLGYLAEQRALGAPPTLCVERTLPDGAIVRARFIYGHPVIEVAAPVPQAAPHVRLELLDGVVTKPRTFSDGNAYGDKAEVLLRAKADSWRSYVYDATTVPEAMENPAFYRRNSRGEDVFPAGFGLSGPMDWRGKGERLAITYMGERTRGLSEMWDVYSPAVWHNGEALLQQETYQIEAACLREEGRDLYLVWIVFGESPTVYRAKLAPHPDLLWWPPQAPMALCPRLAPVAPEQIETIGVLNFPMWHQLRWLSSGYLREGRFVWNQSGTEARKLFLCRDSTLTKYRSLEMVVRLGDVLDAGTLMGTETFVATVGVTEQSTTVFPGVRPAHRIWLDRYTFVEPPSGPNGGEYTPVPVYTCMGLAAGPGEGTTIPEDETVVFVTDATETSTEAYTDDDAMPICVDFEDDVPVYLWWSPGLHESTASWASDLTYSEIKTETYSKTSTLEVRDHAFSDTAAASSSFASSAQRVGSRVWAVGKDGMTWLDIALTASGSGQGNATSSGGFNHTWHQEVALNTQTGYWEETVFDDAYLGQANLSETMSATVAGDTVFFWFLDLRTRSATYTRAREHTVFDRAVSLPILGNVPPSQNPPWRMSGLREGQTTKTVSTAFDTQVVFQGVTTDSWLGALPAATTTLEVINSMVYVQEMTTYSPFGFVAAAAINAGPNEAYSVYSAVFPSVNGLRLPGPPVARGGITSGAHGQAKMDESVAFFAAHADYHCDNEEPEYIGEAPFVGSLSPLVTAPVNKVEQATPFIKYLRARDQETMNQSNQPLGWVAYRPDLIGVPPEYEQLHIGYGTWISHQGGWAFSMAALEGPDATVPKWRHGMAFGTDMNAATGPRTPTPELYSNLWPLSHCLVRAQ